MEMQDFLAGLKDVLEFDKIELKEMTNLKELEGFDSLSIMTIIAFADERFGKKLTATQLASITTVRSLMELIGLERFE
jgi:acyl carrier protein